MTLEEASKAVRLYVEAKEFCAGNSMGSWNWLERLDDCLADIRVELADAMRDMRAPPPMKTAEGSE